MLKNLLVYRLALFNFVIALLAAFGLSQGWVQYVLFNDHSKLSYLILGVLAFGLVGTFHRALKVSKTLNLVKESPLTPTGVRDVQKMPIKNAYLHTVMDVLTGLAIVGTIVGLVLMTKQINVSDLTGSLPTVLSGVSVAFMATLSGIVSAMVLAVNVRMLDTATALLVKDSE